jgi:thiol-disulfide isomerase/thioredoxin
MRRRDVLVLGGVGVAAAGAGALLGAFGLQKSSGAAELLAANFADPAGKQRRLLEWRGSVLVCNFWATWCAPCLEEMPMLSAAQRNYAGKGVVFVGIGIDSVAKIHEFTAKLKVTYQILIGGPEAIQLMRRLGNAAGGLPYTVVLNRSGALAYQRLGALSRQDIDQALVGLLG